MSNFRNIRNDGVQKVSNAAERLALLPSDGYLVEQLDDNSIWAWNQDTAAWVQVGGPGVGDVTSVFGRTGDVIAQTGDYTAAQVGAVALTGDESVSGIKSFTSYPEGPGTSPTQDAQLVDKAYVDLLVTTGARFVDAVLAATTAPIPANTYNNGALGVGATLTGNVNGALAAIDGVTPVLNGKYLIKDEVTQANNGAYLLTQVGDGSNPYILTRLTDYNESSEIVAGTFFTVLNGTVNDNQQWAMHNPATIIVGTTAIEFAQLSTMPTITASLGVQKVGNDVRSNLNAAGAITLSGNSIGVAVDNSTININANAIRVAPLGITNAQVSATAAIAPTKLATITTAGKVTGAALTTLTGVPAGAGILPVANGSTGNSSYAIGDILYASGATTLSKLGIGSNGKVLGVTAGLPSWIDQTGGGGGGLSTIYYSKSLSTNSTPVSVSNSVTETTIYTYTVPANELGTDKIVQGIVEGTYLNNSAANRTVRVRVKYGATTILDKTSGALGTSATPGTFSINFYLANQGATNVQQAYMDCSFESGANVSSDFTDRGVAAIDSTTSQNIVVTVALTNATATQTLEKRLATLNMLNAQDDVGGVLLQTDGVDNGLQTTLNLEAGTGISLTDDGLGTVTIDSVGGGVTIGAAVSGGTATEVLYTDNSGNVYSDPGFTRDSVTLQTGIGVEIPAGYAADNNQPNPFVVIANNDGDTGNSIALVFDGIDDVTTVVAAWNIANPSNQVTIISGGASVPDAGTYPLSGGGSSALILGEAVGGVIYGASFVTQDTTNNINTIFGSGNLTNFTGQPHGTAFFIQNTATNTLTGFVQSELANALVSIDLAGFTFFSNVETSSSVASLSFIDNTTNSGFFAEPLNKTYIKVNSNLYVFPTVGGNTGDVLSIDNISGSDYNLEWVAPSGGGGTPGGSQYEVQLNSGAGTFQATSNFSYNTSNNLVKILSNNGLNVDPANSIYQFGNLGVGNSTSYFNQSDLNNTMSYIGGVPIFGGIGATITGGPNDLSYVQTGYTSRADKTWTIEIDNAPVESGTIFTGVGLDDAVFSGTFIGSTNEVITVSIDGNGTPDTFEWFLNGVSQANGVAITGAAQALSNGISITFSATTGHTSGDDWRVGNGFGAVEYAATSFTGTFQQYETVTGSLSGATATLGYDRSVSSQVILTNISAGGFEFGDVLTGGTSGAVATITALTGINDTFDWSDDGGVTPHPQTPINANNALYTLSDGVDIMWGTTSGHGVGSTWNFSVNLTDITKLSFVNEVATNTATLGDLSNTMVADVPNYVSVDLFNNQVKMSGDSVAIGDVSAAQNGTGLIIVDSLQSSNFYVPSVFTLGDINAVTNGLTFRTSSGEGLVTISTAGVVGPRYFSLDTINEIYNFGDLNAQGNSNSLRIDDAANTIRLGNGSNDIIINSVDSTITLPNGQIQSKVTIVAYGTTTNLTSADYDLEISGSSGAATVNLPTGANSPVGTVYIVGDLGADCSNNNITIDAGTGNTIVAGSSAQTYVMSSDGEVAVLKKVDATRWKVQ